MCKCPRELDGGYVTNISERVTSISLSVNRAPQCQNFYIQSRHQERNLRYAIDTQRRLKLVVGRVLIQMAATQEGLLPARTPCPQELNCVI